MYDVTTTAADGTVTRHTMTWRQVRRYLPGGKLYSTSASVTLHRIVGS